ncbi:MAG: 3-dehydroquinate synthase [Dehalococcoidales bacterium]|nr:3-dehydroquinate synthase [Dehalococcoidales bacterium]
MKEVAVRLATNSYNIRIGSNLLMQTGRWLKESGFTDKLVIITNPVVKKLYGDTLEQNLTKEGFRVTVLPVSDGEEQKSLEVAGRLYTELASCYMERMTPVLALGGGVIGDLAGFVAATYLRGVPLVQIPTTLLAQVDSSIGGKVAVNLGQVKNIVGTFYQPKLVISDIGVLKTLPTKEFTNGLAEVIKYGIACDKELFTFIEQNLEKIKALDEQVLEEIVFRSARIKAGFVEKDERDLGLRAVLNYGHTVGHAIESASDFRVRHGEAVAVGMLTAARISHQLGILDENAITRLRSVMERAGLPTRIPNLKKERMVQAITHDKKVLSGKIRFVLPKLKGEALVTEVTPSLIEQVLVDLE